MSKDKIELRVDIPTLIIRQSHCFIHWHQINVQLFNKPGSFIFPSKFVCINQKCSKSNRRDWLSPYKACDRFHHWNKIDQQISLIQNNLIFQCENTEIHNTLLRIWNILKSVRNQMLSFTNCCQLVLIAYRHMPQVLHTSYGVWIMHQIYEWNV